MADVTEPFTLPSYDRGMPEEPEINDALDAVRREDRTQRDESIDEQIEQTERLSEAIGSRENEPEERAD